MYNTNIQNEITRIHVWYTYSYMWLIFMVNVGTHSIHGSYGKEWVRNGIADHFKALLKRSRLYGECEMIQKVVGFPGFVKSV